MRLRRLGLFFLALLALAALPFVFSSQESLSLMCQMGISIVFCLSYNILLGQGGMLSFSHSVFSGLAGYVAAFILNQTVAAAAAIPVALLPLASGLAGMGFAAVFGYLCTRTSGMAFTMITLGIAELVHTAVQMFPAYFGGEGGISIDRTAGSAIWGLTFGSQREIYGLVAVWLAISATAMYGFVHTPLGRMLNAVRDNSERVDFIGFSPSRVRYLAFLASGLFAGVAGGLTLLNFEIVGAESVDLVRSGEALVYTFIGGTTSFIGPALGAVFGVLLSTRLAEISRAWVLYMGFIFVAFVLYAPDGLAGLLRRAAQQAAELGRWNAVKTALPFAVLGIVAVLATMLSVEMLYAILLGADNLVAARAVVTSSGLRPGTLLGSGIVALVLCVVLWRWQNERRRMTAQADSSNVDQSDSLVLDRPGNSGVIS
jgi:branched-chain amino acid transport system permease protein